jgi:putative phage-type endonuclease
VTAVLLTSAGADRGEWLAARRAGIGASEIAAILGLSPWESPFSLYWRKVNGWEADETDEMRDGTRLEPVVAEWFADECDPHQNLAVVRAGLYAHPDRPWQLATPDRLVHLRCPCDIPFGGCNDCWGSFESAVGDPLAVAECKYVAYSWNGWGEPETNQIPVHYRCQVLWQCDVLNVETWYLAALGPGGFRCYTGRRDDADLRVMRAAGQQFMDRLAAGTPPDIDSHTATGAALRRLHPSVADYDVDVPVTLAEGYRRARALRTRAESVVDRYEHRIRAAIGDGRRAMCGGRLVASRSVYDQHTDMAEADALDTDWPTVNRLNPGRAASYA